MDDGNDEDGRCGGMVQLGFTWTASRPEAKADEAGRLLATAATCHLLSQALHKDDGVGSPCAPESRPPQRPLV